MKCKAYLIDPEKREIREITFSPKYGDPDSLQAILGGYIEMAWSDSLGHVLFVDEDGLSKPQRHFFTWLPRGDDYPLAGRGILVGREITDEEGEYVTNDQPSVPLWMVQKAVRWLTREQVNSWAKANASDPQITITNMDTGERNVIASVGAVFGAMPEPQEE